MEVTQTIGVILALGAAIMNAVQQLCIRTGTDRGKVYDGVFIVMCVNLLILAPLIIIMYFPNYGLTRLSLLSFAAAGLLGTLLGRLFMYTSIDRIGASRTSPITASHALFASFLGIVFLEETMSPLHVLAIILIVGGISFIAWETSADNSQNISNKKFIIIMLIPFGAAVAYGWEPIFATTGLNEGTPPLVGLFIKTTGATAGLLIYLRWRATLSVPSVDTFLQSKWFILAGIANTLFLSAYYFALSLAPVNVVVPISITNVMIVVILSAMFMPDHLENVSWKLIFSSAIVMIGVVIISIQ